MLSFCVHTAPLFPELEERIGTLAEQCTDLLETVFVGEDQYRDSLGWLDIEEWGGSRWVSICEEIAEEIREKATALIVIGIGGSNQGARAVIDALQLDGGVEIIWAGNSISAHSMNEVLKSVEGKDFYIDVIAKNFETLEPGIAFRRLRLALQDKYGDKYADHVICTGTQGSHLEQLSIELGYRFLPFPDNIGGRFSVLSPVGLLPMAAAGIDIRQLTDGARAVRASLVQQKPKENMALKYAVMRYLMYEMGFRAEMLAFFEPRLFRFAKWWAQLFGESEGKDGKGLYPVFGNYSEDLHSIGQFVQDGTPILFETFLKIRSSKASCILPSSSIDDGFDYLSGWDFDDINNAAYQATLAAHSSRFPCVEIEIDALDEKSFGEIFYFYEFVCYLSGKMIQVNPFDQPGVEAYKHNMFRILGK